LEAFERATHRGLGALVPEVPPLEIEEIDVRVDGADVAQARLLVWRERDANPLRDRAGQLPLESQDVAEVAFVAFGPEVPVAHRVDELGGDPHALSNAEDRAFHHRLHVQLARDLAQGSARALEPHRRRARDHLEGRDLAEVRDEGFRHAVGEVLLLGLGREILEGEDGHRTESGRARRESAR
jgi:hypothetical protein